MAVTDIEALEESGALDKARREGWDLAIVAAAKEVESLLERGRTIRETAAAIRALPYPG